MQSLLQTKPYMYSYSRGVTLLPCGCTLNHLELKCSSIGEIAGQRSWGHYAAGVVLRCFSFGPRVE
eukprot:844044-Prymnesium_polylepis.1